MKWQKLVFSFMISGYLLQLHVLYCINILLYLFGNIISSGWSAINDVDSHHHQETRRSFFFWVGCSKNLGTISYHPLLFANVFDRNWPKNYRAWNWPQIFTFLSLGCSIERWFIIEVWRRICFIKVVATGNTVAIAAIV